LGWDRYVLLVIQVALVIRLYRWFDARHDPLSAVFPMLLYVIIRYLKEDKVDWSAGHISTFITVALVWYLALNLFPNVEPVYAHADNATMMVRQYLPSP